MSSLGDLLRIAAGTADALQTELDNSQYTLQLALAELDACQNPSPFELLFEEDWSSGIDESKWFIGGGAKFGKDHAELLDGKLHLDVRVDADNVWRGGLVGLREPLTYGKVEVDCYLEPGNFRGVALLWPKSEKWPQDTEVDFFEIGGDDPERITNTQTFHYGVNPNHPMIHTSYTDDEPFTEHHTIGVECTPGSLAYTCNGAEMARVDSVFVPSWPMKPHVQSARPGGSITPSEGSFVVEAIRVYSWKDPQA